MKKRFKSIIFSIVTCFIFMILGDNIVLASTPYNFSFEAYRCNIEYTSETTINEIKNACGPTQYKANSLQKISNGENVEPGQMIMLVLKYALGTPDTAISFQLEVNYNTSFVSPVYAVNRKKIELVTNWDAGLGYDGTGYLPETTWSGQSNDTGNSIRLIIQDSTQENPFSSEWDVPESGPIYYLYFNVKDDAIPGSSFNFNYNDSFSTAAVQVGVDPLAKPTSTPLQLNVYGEMSADNSLNTLTIKNNTTIYPLTPTFVSGSSTTSYTTYVPNDISSIDIAATVKEEHATILDGSVGTKNLNVGDNTFDVVVQAQNGENETYQINVRRLQNDATLSSLSLNEASIGTFNSNTYTYEATVPYSSTSGTISFETNDVNATSNATTSFAFPNYGNTKNTKEITVNAENCNTLYASVPGNTCTSKTYTINVTRTAPSTNNLLSMIYVDDVAINNYNKNTFTYDLDDINYNKSSIKFTANLDDSLATIESGIGEFAVNVGDNQYEIVVLSESGVRKTYTINVYRKSNNANLKSLTISSNPQGTLLPTFSPTFYSNYTYNYPSDTTSVTINATVDHINATVSGTGTFNVPATEQVSIIVTSENGDTSTYVINLERQKSTNNDLSALSLNYGTLTPNFDKDTSNYTASVSADISSVTVSATAADSYATITSDLGDHNLNFGTNTIQVRVKSEAGVNRDYTIIVTREKNTDATLSDIKLNNTSISSFNKDTITYNLSEVPYETTSIDLEAILTDTTYAKVTATLNGTSVPLTDNKATFNLKTGSNIIVFNTVAHDNTTKKAYTLNITRTKNNDTSITSVSVKSLNATCTNTTCTLTVPNAISRITASDIIVNTNDSTAKVTKTTGTLDLLTTQLNNYNFDVTAEDGNTRQTYTIQITRTKSSNNKLTSVDLTIPNSSYTQTCNISGTGCSLTVPSGTSSINLVGNAEDSAATVTGDGSVAITEKNETVQIKVTSEDNTEAVYSIIITKLESSNSYLSSLTVDNVSVTNFRKEQQVYRMTLDSSHSKAIINAVVEDTGKATITSTLGEKNLSFGENQIDIIVNAEDQTPRTYTLFITRSASTDATLSDIKLNNTSISSFNKDTITYNLSEIPYETTSIDLEAILTDTTYAKVTATLNGTSVPLTDNKATFNLKTGSNVIIFNTVAHDNTTKKAYTLNITRTKNNDTSITSVSVKEQNATCTNTTCTITLPNSVSRITTTDISIVTNDSTAKVIKTTGTLNLSTKQLNTYNFKVTAENGTTEEIYTIQITRTKSNNNKLISVDLTIPNNTYSQTCIVSNKICNLTVPALTTTVNLVGQKEDATATISNDGQISITNALTTQNIIVTAEDGTEETYEVKITRLKSSNSYLSSLTVDNVSVTNFRKEQQVYRMTLDSSHSKATINAVVEDTGKATITSTLGEKNLSFGENQIDVIVTAEDQTPRTYTLFITRSASTDATLSDIKLNNTSISSFNKDTITYNLSEVPYETTSIDLEAILTDTTYAKVTATLNGTSVPLTDNKATFNLKTGSNVIIFNTVAHDNTTKKAYTLNITRTKNDDTSITGVTVKNLNTNCIDTICTITVPNSISSISADDIDITLNDTNATSNKTTGTLNLSTKQLNTYNFKVTAENGTTEKMYTIQILRTKSNDASLKEVQLVDGEYNTRCVPTNHTCTLYVPVETTSYTITPITTHEFATTSETIIGTLDASVKNHQITITAEDGTTDNYTITINRAISNNANLYELKIDGTLIKGFKSDTLSYNVEVEGTVSSMTISAVVEDLGKAIITNDSDLGLKSLEFGINTFTITVKAENLNRQSYTITVNRKLRSINTLENIQINSVDITNFNKNTLEYTLDDYGYNTNSISITPTLSDPDYASYLINNHNSGVINLATGDNTINIVVTAHNGDKKTYKINVFREYNNNTEISNLKVNNVAPTYNSKTGEYSLTVPYAKTKLLQTDVTLDLVDTNSSVVKLNELDLKTTENNVYTFEVTAEDNVTKKTYKINITRTKSDDATLSSLSITGGTFDPVFSPNTTTYNILVPTNTTEFDVTGVVNEEHATIISGNGHYLMDDSSMVVKVVVLPEDQSKAKTYTLNISRMASSINTLSGLSINNGSNTYTLSPIFSENTTSYTVTVPSTIEYVDIIATPTDSKATVSGDERKSLDVGQNTITINVKAESGPELNYVVTVTRERKTVSTLATLKVDGFEIENFDKDVLEYNLENVLYTTTSIELTGTTTDSDATISGLGTRYLNTGDNAIEVTVTAQDGVTKTTYTLNIERIKNNNADLKILSVANTVLNPVFNANTTTYNITLPYNIEELTADQVTAIAYDMNAVVTKTEQVALSTTTTVDYIITVTAENSTIKRYTLKVKREKSDNALLSEINLTDATLSPNLSDNTRDYIITVPSGISTFTIEAIPYVNSTDVSYETSHNISEGQFDIITTAENGTEETYHFTIQTSYSNDATLSSLSISGYSLDKQFNSTKLTYTINSIPYNAGSLYINATASNANSTVSYYVDNQLQESNVVTLPIKLGNIDLTIKVKAPDMVTEKIYQITLTKIASTNAYLSEMSLNYNDTIVEKIINKAIYSYSFDVPNSVTSATLKLTTEDVLSVIKINDGIEKFNKNEITLSDLQIGDNTIVITTKAQNDSIKTYNVAINRAASTANSDATLSNLSIENHSLNLNFNRDVDIYSIGQIPFQTDELIINATPTFGTSKITYIVNGLQYSMNNVPIPLTNGNGAIEIKVTAEDNSTTKYYKINYYKVASTNAYLSNLLINEGTLEFNKTNLRYVVNVDSDVTSVDISAITEDINTKINYLGTNYTTPKTITKSISNGQNVVNITTTAEDGTTLNYTIIINKQSGSEQISSTVYGHNIADGYIYTVKIGINSSTLKQQIDNDASKIQIWSADENRRIGDNEVLGTGMIVKLFINNVEIDRKTIVIKGDIDGDGVIDLSDSIKIINHYLERRMLSGAYEKAAYCDGDDVIDLSDSIRIINHFLERRLLH